MLSKVFCRCWNIVSCVGQHLCGKAAKCPSADERALTSPKVRTQKTACRYIHERRPFHNEEQPYIRTLSPCVRTKRGTCPTTDGREWLAHTQDMLSYHWQGCREPRGSCLSMWSTVEGYKKWPILLIHKPHCSICPTTDGKMYSGIFQPHGR